MSLSPNTFILTSRVGAAQREWRQRGTHGSTQALQALQVVQHVEQGVLLDNWVPLAVR
jgi:hypothetical protein